MQRKAPLVVVRFYNSYTAAAVASLCVYVYLVCVVSFFFFLFIIVIIVIILYYVILYVNDVNYY